MNERDGRERADEMGNFAILIETSMRIQSKLNEMMLGKHDETALFVILEPTSVLSTLRLQRPA